MKDAIEYELVDMEWSLNYDFTEDSVRIVCDGTDNSEDTQEQPSLELDAQGIPCGYGREYTEARRIIISEFFYKWKELHPEKRIYNNNLKDHILIRGISIVEAKEHAAKRYNSTKAVLCLEEVLMNARPLRRVEVKKDNSNQSAFDYMLVMIHELEGVGLVKLTIGVKDRRMPVERVQYGISAIDSMDDIFASKDKSNKKKAPHKK